MPQRLSDNFLDNLTKRIQAGLFPQASERRNRYVIKNRTENQLRFCSFGLLTGAYIGLNDVTIQVESGGGIDRRVAYQVRYWAWILYCIILGLCIVLSLVAYRFLICPGWFAYWWYKQPKFFHSIYGEIIFWFFIVFFGLLWPWILCVLHKKNARKMLLRIFDEVNQS